MTTGVTTVGENISVPDALVNVSPSPSSSVNRNESIRSSIDVIMKTTVAPVKDP